MMQAHSSDLNNGATSLYQRCNGMVDWIAEALDKPGKSRTGLAKAMGIHPSGVTALMQGTRQLKLHEAQKAAAYLEVSLPSSLLPAVQELPISYVEITGEAAGGVWAEPGLRYRREVTSIPAEAGWPVDAIFALRVRGDSINRKAQDGDLVVCLDLTAAPRSPRPKDWVILERKRGGLIETSVKLVREQDGQVILSSFSDDPSFCETFSLTAVDGEELRIAAYVLRFVREGTIF